MKNVEKEVTVTSKERVRGSVQLLIDKFVEATKKFKVHTFNITNQLNHYRFLKENLKTNEALVHVDFSENFQCKLSTEIQSMHYGASQNQITLHTGIYYTQNGYNTFCAVSDSLEHSPGGIWAFLEPVIAQLLSENKDIDTIHFFSDGPCTQYKQKGNFYLLSKEMSEKGITAWWNFHESGHGKGVPDGFGGSLKRTANDLVLHGKDITNAASFVKCIHDNDSSVSMYEVSPDVVSQKKNLLNSTNLKTVPGTLKIHQVKTSKEDEIMYRDISCVFDDGDLHSGHEWKYYMVTNTDPKIENSKETLRKSKKDRDVLSKKKKNEPGMQSKKTSDLEMDIEDTDNRIPYFENVLKEFEGCENFEELRGKCAVVFDAMKNQEMCKESSYIPTLRSTGLSVDNDALRMLPSDIPSRNKLYPIEVSADGNCLPSTGSILSFGNKDKPAEMRVKIIIESAIHKELYLSQAHLERGIKTSNTTLAKTYALYSDEFIPNQRLGQEQVEEIYEKEIMNITKDKSYMGIWQIFALSSVLGTPLFAAYPKLGNPVVRLDLHRLVEPREKKSTNTKYLMWTTTRKDMHKTNWIPNHFLALLPADNTNHDVHNKPECVLEKPRRSLRKSKKT